MKKSTMYVAVLLASVSLSAAAFAGTDAATGTPPPAVKSGQATPTAATPGKEGKLVQPVGKENKGEAQKTDVAAKGELKPVTPAPVDAKLPDAKK